MARRLLAPPAAGHPATRRRRRQAIPDDNHIARLLHLAPPAERLCICLLCDAGCRLREALAFDVSSLSGTHQNPLLRIWSTKTRTWRTVPVPARLARAIAAGPRTLRSLTPRTTQRRLLELSAAASAPEFTPHRLRHSYATRLNRAGIPLHLISQLLGHKSVAVTLIYLHTGETDYAKARRALDRLARHAPRSAPRTHERDH